MSSSNDESLITRPLEAEDWQALVDAWELPEFDEGEGAAEDEPDPETDEEIAAARAEAERQGYEVGLQKGRDVGYQEGLAAAREEIEKARCDNCNETVQLGLLVEPACPHCRSAFDGIEPGSMFFKSAWLTIADRPALEAGETTEQPFEANGSDAQSVDNDHTHRTDQ